MKKLELRLSEGRVCRVWIGRDLFSRTSRPAFWKNDPILAHPGKAFLIADSRLRAHTKRVEDALRHRGWQTRTLFVAARESSKSLRALDPVYRELILAGADRASVVFAVGGGVIGDLSGFIAATYMRGIRWVGVPTTLLAQVDSAIGGKTGVNHSLGKNLIGAFHQPSSVICDLAMLETLPRREIVSGLGEVAKYALLEDRKFYRWIDRNWHALARLEPSTLEEAVARCLGIKASVVRADERETRGQRVILNLGHTVAHALETATRFKKFRHGEAVLHGLRAVVRLSAERGHLSEARRGEIMRFLNREDLPSIPSGLSAEKISRLALHDKKNEKGKRRFVLIRDVGKPLLDDQVSERELRIALHAIGFRGAGR